MGILVKQAGIKGGHILERQNINDAFMGKAFLKDHDYQSLYHA
jgi:hypothetical protein